MSALQSGSETYWLSQVQYMRETLGSIFREVDDLRSTVERVLGAMTVATPSALGLGAEPESEPASPRDLHVVHEETDDETGAIERVEIERTETAAHLETTTYLGPAEIQRRAGVASITTMRWGKESVIRTINIGGPRGTRYCIEDVIRVRDERNSRFNYNLGSSQAIRRDLKATGSVLKTKRGSLGDALAAKQPEVYQDLWTASAESRLAPYTDDRWLSLSEASEALGLADDVLPTLRDKGMVEYKLKPGIRRASSGVYRPSEYMYAVPSLRKLVEYLPLVASGSSWDEVASAFAVEARGARRKA